MQEDSRKTSELAVVEGVAAVRLRADGNVRFYALGVSNAPYNEGDELAEQPAGGGEGDGQP